MIAKQWKPVKDGQYGNARVGENGSELWMTAHDPSGNEWYADTFWGDDYRVCEPVDVPDATIPVEVREAAMRASAWLVDMLNDYRGDGMDDLRADVIMWRAWLTELEATA